MLSHRLIATGFSLALSATAVLGGVVGNAVTAQNLDDLAARENVTTLVEQNLSTTDYIAGTQARATLDALAPTIEAAAALVESSAGKASDASRAALQAILDEIEVETTAHVATGAEARETAEQIVATGTRAIEAASKVVSDEVVAWEAEQARIAAEQAAAEEAAREAAQRSNNGSRNSTGSSGGSSNDNGGSTNNSGGGGGSFRDWIESEAASWGVSVEYIDGSISYGMKNRIQIANVVADAGGDRAMQYVRHEIAHAIAYRDGSCMDAGLNTEVTAQYVSMKIWGFYVDVYRTPTAAENDALRAVCG